MSRAEKTDILVFKTNIRFKKELRQLEPVLKADKRIIRWNVDRQDADKVLRVESKQLQAHEVIRLVSRAGYFCEELPD